MIMAEWIEAILTGGRMEWEVAIAATITVTRYATCVINTVFATGADRPTLDGV
jgi:hypothetical protein